MQIGTNLEGLSYWATGLPLLNLVKSSSVFFTQRPGKWDTKEPIDFDANGWPKSIPSGANLGLSVIRETGPVAPANARYVLLYSGEGRIEGMLGTTKLESAPGRMVIRSAPNGSIHLQIYSTDPNGTGNYIRDLHVVREDQLPAYQSGALFNPKFTEKLKGFNVVRFMDWMAANKLYASDGTRFDWGTGKDPLSVGELNWQDRPRLEDARWTEGVPVEMMVQLANELDIDPWFTLPINASDDYVRGFAQYVQRHLEPGRKMRVELSNEVWNFSFPQATYAKLRAEQEFGAGAKWLEWYGKRTAEVGAIWNQVFGEPITGTGDPGRVIVVFGTQFAWKGLEGYGLDTVNWKDAEGNHRRAADYFDDYAVASYYEGGMHQDKNAAEVMSWWNDADGGFEKAVAALNKTMKDYTEPNFLYHGEKAKKYGLDLTTYEAGYGALTPLGQHSNDTYTNFLVAVGRRPEIYDLDMANAEGLRSAGGTLFTNFTLIGRPSKWGSWAALEDVDQETSHRYRALRTLLEQRKTGGTAAP